MNNQSTYQSYKNPRMMTVDLEPILATLVGRCFNAISIFILRVNSPYRIIEVYLNISLAADIASQSSSSLGGKGIIYAH